MPHHHKTLNGFALAAFVITAVGSIHLASTNLQMAQLIWSSSNGRGGYTTTGQDLYQYTSDGTSHKNSDGQVLQPTDTTSHDGQVPNDGTSSRSNTDYTVPDDNGGLVDCGTRYVKDHCDPCNPNNPDRDKCCDCYPQGTKDCSLNDRECLGYETSGGLGNYGGDNGWGLPPPPPDECEDGYDNDNDGLIDEKDPGCRRYNSQFSGSEQTATTACQDGKDNDNDGLTDLEDPGCYGFRLNDDEGKDTSACQDGKDNDNDGRIDRQDPGCVDNRRDS
ncbi:MAG: hypothetical protein O2904_04860 [bacterium]|nr:hypothetical protein [bacterium]